MAHPAHYDIAALRAQVTASLTRQRAEIVREHTDERIRAAFGLVHDLYLAGFELTALTLQACNDGMSDETAEAVVGQALGTLHANLVENFGSEAFRTGLIEGHAKTAAGLDRGGGEGTNLHFKPTKGGSA